MQPARLVLFLFFVSIFCITACGRESDFSTKELPWIATPISLGSTETEIKLGLHTPNAVGEKKYVVIMADFPDVERKFSESAMAGRLLKFLSNYLYEASYHRLTFKGEMTRRYVLPYPVGHYKISSANLEVDKDKVLSLVSDVVNAADADVRFSEDLYVIISLGATNVEYGMVGYSAVPGMLGFTNTTPITTKSGEIVSNAVVFCENAHLGTTIHDALHMLGGVVDGRRMAPCLYDHDLQAKYADSRDPGKFAVNMGYWDPLSSHVPYNREFPPTGLSAWTKLRLGWIDPVQIALVYPGDTITVKLDPLVNLDASTLVVKIPLSDFTYYLIENRQPLQSDVNLPSSGVLITYADDTVLECRQGSAPVKIVDANPEIPYLNGAAFDLGKKDTFVDHDHNLAIILLEKEGDSYLIQITTPGQVAK